MSTLEKEDAQNAEGKDSGGSGTETEKKFTQDDINRIIAKESKKWEKEHSETFTKAKEYEKLQEEINKTKEAELSEVQKLQKTLNELAPLKDKAETLEKFVTSQYEELAAELSAEDKETLDELSIPVTEKLNLAKRLLAKSGSPVTSNGAARASAGVTNTPDKLTALAEEKMRIIWPREAPGTESYKLKLERIKAELKLQQR